MMKQSQNNRKADEQNDSDQSEDSQQLSFLQTIVSVMQASFGVQSSKNKQRDFEKGSIKGFVAAALIFTVLFVLTLVIVVSLVLP